MQAFVQSLYLLFSRHADRPYSIDDYENNVGNNKGIRCHADNAQQLHKKLMRTGINRINGPAGQYAQQQRTSDPAHAVCAPNFKGVVKVQALLHYFGKIAHRCPGCADDYGSPRIYIACARGNGFSALAPVAIGFLISITGSYMGGLLYLVGCAALGAVVMLILIVSGR